MSNTSNSNNNNNNNNINNNNYMQSQPLNASTDYCFQPYSAPTTPSTSTCFPIIQENQSIKRDQSSQLQHPKPKTAELKFKIESVGIHPEDDDDLDMCPARTRPSWPKQIIPWWTPSHPNEKPPYSYATLIAHAILSSKDGRLTLNDIYTWISKNYPTFSVGNGGWQNSIRHNLSLNKKWFYKIDRRPTQANPGKGCYWTLIAGTEQIFIDNLTQEGGHSRKHHDIGLTTELSVGQRRGACYYNHNNVTPTPPTTTHTTPLPSPLQLGPHTTRSITLDTPPSTPTKPDLARPLVSPLYTTFRMVDMTPKSDGMTTSAAITADDSDNDSGVDVGNEYVDRKHFKKRRRTTTFNTPPAITLGYGSNDLHPPLPPQQHVNSGMLYNTSVTPFGLIPETPNYEINHWVEQSLLCSEPYNESNLLSHSSPWIPTTSYPSSLHPYQQPLVSPIPLQPQPQPQPQPQSQQQPTTNWSDNSNNQKKRYPITINLDDEEVTKKYLHFEDDEDDTTIIHTTHNNNNVNNNNSNSNSYYSLYPYNNNSSSSTTTNNYASTAPSPYPFDGFVSMQDILYS